MAIVFDESTIVNQGHDIKRTGMIICPHRHSGGEGFGIPTNTKPEFYAADYVSFRFNIDMNINATTFPTRTRSNGETFVIKPDYWKLRIYNQEGITINGHRMNDSDIIRSYYFDEPYGDNANCIQHITGFRNLSVSCFGFTNADAEIGYGCGAYGGFSNEEALTFPIDETGWNKTRKVHWKLTPYKAYYNAAAGEDRATNFGMGGITGYSIVPAAFSFSNDSGVSDAPWGGYSWHRDLESRNATLETRKNVHTSKNSSVNTNLLWNPNSKSRMYAHSFEELIMRTNGASPATASNSSTHSDSNSVTATDSSFRQSSSGNATRVKYRQLKTLMDSWWWSGHTYAIKVIAKDRNGGILDTHEETFSPPPTVDQEGGARSYFEGYHDTTMASAEKQSGTNRPKLNLQIKSSETTHPQHAAYHHIEIRHQAGGTVLQRFTINGFDNSGNLIDYSTLRYSLGVVELNEDVIPNIEYNQQLHITFRAKTNTHIPNTDSGGDITTKEITTEYVAYKDWQFSSDFASGLAIQTPTVDAATGEFNIGNLYVYTRHNDRTAHWFRTEVHYIAANGTRLNPLTGLFVTSRGNGEARASINGEGLETRTHDNGVTYYRLPLGNDMFVNLNTHFQSVYDAHDYVMDIKVLALDNEFNVLDSTHVEGDFHRYDFSENYAIEGAVFAGNQNDGESYLAIQEDTTASKVGLTRYLRPVFFQEDKDGSTTGVSMSLQYKESDGTWSTTRKYFSTGFGPSEYRGHGRTNWIEADDFADYQSKLADGETHSKLYVPDISDAETTDTSLFKNVDLKAILYFYDDNGDPLDIQFDETLTITGYPTYTFDIHQLSSNDNKTNTLDNFYVRAYSKDETGNIPYFDYMRLEIRQKNNHNNIFTPRSAGNGNTFWNTHTFQWTQYLDGSSIKDLDISPVISNRFVNTELEFRIRAVSSGVKSKDSNYYIRNGPWTDFTVPKITFDFNTLTMSIHGGVNNFSNVHVVVGFSPGSKHTNYANKFRLRVWDHTMQSYAAAPAASKTEFTLDGLQFSSSDQLIHLDENNNFLDISTIMGQWGRWVDNDVMYEIAALKENGSVIASKSAAFTVPAVDWHMDTTNTSLTLTSDFVEETQARLRVYRVSSTDTIPQIQIGIRAKTNVDGTTPSGTTYYIRFDTQVFNTPGNTMFEDFTFTFPDGLDRNKASKYEYTITGQIYDGTEYRTLGELLTKELSYTPWYKPNTITVSLSKSDITEKRATVTVQPLLATHLTREPSTVRLRFIRDNDSAKKVEYNFNSNFNNFSGSFDIGEIYADAPLTDTLLKCEVLPGNAENIKQTSSNITIPAEPEFTLQESSQGKNVIIDDSGNEYIAFRFKPVIQSNFIPAGQKYTLNFMIGDSISESIEVDGSTLDNTTYLSYSLPTGFNVSDNYTEQTYNNAKMSASYTMNRTFDDTNVFTTNLTMAQNKRTNAYNNFPSSFNTLEQGFDSSANSEATISYQDSSKTYLTDLSSFWEFEASFKETVVNSLDSGTIGTDKETDVSSTFRSNNFSITTKIPTEANYLSNIELTVKEKFKNQEAFGTASTWDLYKAGDLNPNSPSFSDVFVNTKGFTSEEVLMNDISKYPLTSSGFTEVDVENIFGNYALSGRRMKFKLSNPTLPFTNTESYYSLGVKVNHNTSQNVKADSSGLYIKSDGNLYYSQDPANDPEVDNIKNLYTLNDLNSDGVWYYVDTEIDLTKVNFDSAIWDDDNLEIQFKLLLYKEILATTYDSSGEARKVSSLEYTDLDSWANMLSSNSELLKQNISNTNASVIAFGGVSEETSEVAEVKLTSSYRVTNERSFPYYGSLPTAGAKMQIKQDNQLLNSDIFYGNTFSDSIDDLVSILGDKSLLDVSGYDPRYDVTISSVPTTTTTSPIGNVNFYSNLVEFSDNISDITANYSNKIIPSFEELTVDNDLNEDTVAGDSEHKNKIFWFYNKVPLKNRIKVFSYSEEYISVIRKIRQGNNVYDGLNSNQSVHVGVEIFNNGVFTQSSFDSDTFKFEYNDDSINISKYVNQGLNPNKPYIFEYELIPGFRYKAPDDSTHNLINFDDKKVSAFVIPDEFPISNGGVTDVDFNYNNKHSVEIKWAHVYNESVITLHSIDASISFELYYYFDETQEQKNHSNPITKPRLEKLERILQRQSTPDSWSLIDKIPYKFPSSPEEDKAYPYSYIWEYDKLDTDASLSIIILTKIESEFVGAAISQNISDRGPVNTITIDLLQTDDKNKKNNLVTESDKKLEHLRHLVRSEEFILKANLEQVPFSVTRKKAKIRNSNKPYTSTT